MRFLNYHSKVKLINEALNIWNIAVASELLIAHYILNCVEQQGKVEEKNPERSALQ